MAHNDPFTIDLFGCSSLSSGLDLGLTAFPCLDARAGAANDDDPPPMSPAPAPVMPRAAKHSEPVTLKDRGTNFHLTGDRGLARRWKERARANVAAIRLAGDIEREERPATRTEQKLLICFIGFGASDLANGMFRRPGEGGFRNGWDELGVELQGAVSTLDYASLARCTQYAHFTPEFIVRAIWAGLQRLGWRGGRVLEPGIGTGLFAALMPKSLCDVSFVTGVEIDPVTARIARLLQPRARIIEGDFARAELPANFDLAIGNPPFSDRTVRSDPAYRSHAFRLHDFFIAKAIDRLKPGALAAFVTSSGTMDKADASAREHIAKKADLVGAIRLPEGSFRAEAGTDVVVDILFFRMRKVGDAEGDRSWLHVGEVRPTTGNEGAIRVNRWFAKHPDQVLGHHALTSGPFGERYTCLRRAGEEVEAAFDAAILSLPEALYDGEPDAIDPDVEEELTHIAVGSAAEIHVREGSYFVDNRHGLMQIVDGAPITITVRKGRCTNGAADGVTRR